MGIRVLWIEIIIFILGLSEISAHHKGYLVINQPVVNTSTVTLLRIILHKEEMKDDSPALGTTELFAFLHLFSQLLQS